jgi:hypothetical protein
MVGERLRMRRLPVLAAAIAIVVAGLINDMPRAVADDSICTSAGQYCGFYSPSHNIGCEINTGGRVGPDSAYCQTNEPPQSVHMDNTGAFQSCNGVSCLGNAAQGTPVLAYGQTIALGPFACLSEQNGVTCTAAGGRGFTISRNGIAPAG